jgi:hypothetical protein
MAHKGSTSSMYIHIITIVAHNCNYNLFAFLTTQFSGFQAFFLETFVIVLSDSNMVDS